MIVENGVNRPRKELMSMVGHQEDNAVNCVSFGADKIPHANIRFSLIHNDIHSPIFAVGAAAHFPSFLHKMRVR